MAATVPGCSVVVPTYNRAELLRRTLDSLAGQQLPRTSFEVLVVDDGSSDHTAELVGSYHDRLELRYFFQPDEGWRVAQARNVGISRARAEVCVFVDSGVVLHSGCLRAHLDRHRQADRPTAVLGYVHGNVCEGAEAEAMARALRSDDPDTSIDLLAAIGRWPDIRDSLYARCADELDGLPAPWILCWTGNFSAPIERLSAVGGFDEQFRSWGDEDIDLGYRLHLAGVRFVVDRSASSFHYPHGSDFGHNLSQARDNHRYMARKYGTPVAQLLPLLGGALNYHNFNDLIIGRGLPDCREYLRQQAADAG
jgi:glycosyltransferase involved in cell wall biosynthesis